MHKALYVIHPASLNTAHEVRHEMKDLLNNVDQARMADAMDAAFATL